jgi:hypothetical protein
MSILSDVVRGIRQGLRLNAIELRLEVIADREHLVSIGACPQEIARTGTLELAVADFCDALGGGRP